MTFALRAKNELARRPFGDSCCQAAELAAFVRLNGTVQISGKHITLNVVTSNAATARRLFSLFKQLFHFAPELLVRRRNRPRKNNVYLVRIAKADRVREVLSVLGLIQDGLPAQGIDPAFRENKCCRRAYLRGAFLAAGSVSNPEHSYHLEIYTDYRQHAEDLAALLETFGISVKITRRKNGHLLYLKDSEQIVEFLNVIGAHSALLAFENVRILKDMRNRVNRLVNFETANVGKTVAAAVRQVEAIRLIERRIGLDALPPSLRELARLRLQHPEASLQELGEMLDPPLGKSGVNHRMRRLEKLSRTLLAEKREAK
ncbi:MAG: DNA-binding protein WhiA [Firmicutes bacterium]|nr:DNA-binding protein WhiA [Bacillota bacterium]